METLRPSGTIRQMDPCPRFSVWLLLDSRRTQLAFNRSRNRIGSPPDGRPGPVGEEAMRQKTHPNRPSHVPARTDKAPRMRSETSSRNLRQVQLPSFEPVWITRTRTRAEFCCSLGSDIN